MLDSVYMTQACASSEEITILQTLHLTHITTSAIVPYWRLSMIFHVLHISFGYLCVWGCKDPSYGVRPKARFDGSFKLHTEDEHRIELSQTCLLSEVHVEFMLAKLANWKLSRRWEDGRVGGLQCSKGCQWWQRSPTVSRYRHRNFQKLATSINIHVRSCK